MDQIDNQPMPTSPSSSVTSFSDQMTLMAFLREEAEANRKAQREESNANRQLLIDTLKIVSPVLTAVILAASFWGFHDLQSVKRAIEGAANTEFKVELAREKTEVDKKIGAEVDKHFEGDKIQNLIEKTAESETSKNAEPLIVAGVNNEVKKVMVQADQLIRPVDGKVTEALADLKIAQLYLRANEDDASAFDELITHKDNSANKDLIARFAADARSTISGLGKKLDGDGNNCAPNSDSFKAALASPESSKRSDAINDCIAWSNSPQSGRHILGSESSMWESEEDLVPILARTAATDNSLIVRGYSIFTINSLFSHSPGFPTTGLDVLSAEGAKAWWQSVESDYRARELISLVDSVHNEAGEKRENIDDAGLYEELGKIRGQDRTTMADAIKVSMNRMELTARSGSVLDPAAALKAKSMNSCAAVQGDFGQKLKELDSLQENADLLETRELFFLRTCPSQSIYLPLIVKYAVGSESLQRRCAATSVLNNWLSLDLDPFDARRTDIWWKEHGSISKMN